MRERVGRIIGEAVEGMPWLGTFHSVGAKMLRRHAELAGLQSNFTILDTDDQLRLLKQLIQAAGIDEKRWPARQLGGLIDRRSEEHTSELQSLMRISYAGYCLKKKKNKNKTTKTHTNNNHTNDSKLDKLNLEGKLIYTMTNDLMNLTNMLVYTTFFNHQINKHH